MAPLDLLIYGAAAVVLHEAAHVVFALALKVKIHQVGMNWRGAYIRRECGPPKKNLAITLAGPGMNLLLAALFYRVVPNFAWCNLVIGIVNLMPIPMSDGSRALKVVRGLFGGVGANGLVGSEVK